MRAVQHCLETEPEERTDLRSDTEDACVLACVLVREPAAEARELESPRTRLFNSSMLDRPGAAAVVAAASMSSFETKEEEEEEAEVEEEEKILDLLFICTRVLALWKDPIRCSEEAFLALEASLLLSILNRFNRSLMDESLWWLGEAKEGAKEDAFDALKGDVNDTRALALGEVTTAL